METGNDITIFSGEERREIAAQIEAAAGRSPMEISRMPVKGEASKRGLFPLLVNAGAAVLLAAGIFFMFFFQRAEAAEINESGAILGLTERRLIQEIRRETSRRIGEKETAIEEMNARIAGIDAEIARLDSLGGEQRGAMADLRGRHDEYRLSLDSLMIERAHIVAEARQKEADLYAGVEEQRGAPENLSAQSGRELQAARDELSRLSGDQEKAAFVARQLNAYFTIAGRRIQAGQYEEASDTIAALGEFLNTPAFQSLRGIQARRESDLAAAAVLSAAVEALKTGGGPALAAAPAAPQTAEKSPEAAELSRQVAELDRQLAGKERRVTELEEELRKERERYNNDMGNLKNQIKNQTDTIDSLNRQLKRFLP